MTPLCVVDCGLAVLTQDMEDVGGLFGEYSLKRQAAQRIVKRLAFTEVERVVNGYKLGSSAYWRGLTMAVWR
jgi:hypothetical protein